MSRIRRGGPSHSLTSHTVRLRHGAGSSAKAPSRTSKTPCMCMKSRGSTRTGGYGKRKGAFSYPVIPFGKKHTGRSIPVSMKSPLNPPLYVIHGWYPWGVGAVKGQPKADLLALDSQEGVNCISGWGASTPPYIGKKSRTGGSPVPPGIQKPVNKRRRRRLSCTRPHCRVGLRCPYLQGRTA